MFMKRVLTGALFAAATFAALASQPQRVQAPASKPASAFHQANESADPDTDWIPCAREFQTCYTPGPAQVRFGGGGRYSATRQVFGEVECTIAAFGTDPARRVPKMCEYKLGWPPGSTHSDAETNNPRWVECAKEEELCRFRGTRLVRFGADNKYHYLTAEREVLCSVSQFGDPARRTPKTCQIKRWGPTHGDGRNEHGDRPGAIPPVAGRPANQWAHCATEGESCRVSSPTVIRFGRDGDFHYREVEREIRCTTKQFGDPTPGMVKVCEANTIAPDQVMARRLHANDIPPLNDALWNTCAAEGQSCRFKGGEHVRYGAHGVYRVIFATDGLACDARSFGGDPVRGVPKHCDIYRP
jgi:hypothetical protein